MYVSHVNCTDAGEGVRVRYDSSLNSQNNAFILTRSLFFLLYLSCHVDLVLGAALRSASGRLASIFDIFVSV